MTTPRRETRRMEPTSLTRVVKPIPAELGHLLDPGEAEEPILTPPVRKAVLGWLREIEARADLAAAGLKPRTSCLLEGPPGCGKTTLAHHVAARLGIPMLVVGAENLFGMYLGESEKSVANLFDAVDDHGANILLFLDELDAIGGKRVDDVGGGGATAARNSMLTVLLRRLERTEALVVAATNRPDTLDPALWRRFGLQLTVDLPSEAERWAILKHYGAPYAFAADLLDELAFLTEGASPALLRQLMEGLKRNLVLGPRLGTVAADAAEAVAAVTAAVRPHPDYEPPPLWSMIIPHAAAALWPPARAEG